MTVILGEAQQDYFSYNYNSTSASRGHSEQSDESTAYQQNSFNGDRSEVDSSPGMAVGLSVMTLTLYVKERPKTGRE